MSLRILKPGAFSTVQDLGRPGHASRGVPAGGAADRVSLILANRLVGNPDHAAAIEMTLVGATIATERDATVALAGATPAGARVHTALRLKAGDTLTLGPLAGGVRCYLGVAGGVDVTPALASRSTLAASALGGHEGRPLRTGDVLPLGHSCTPPPPPGCADALGAPQSRTLRKRLRVVTGPHAAALGRAALDTLLAREFTVSDRSDRVGLRLDGSPIAPERPGSGEMITEPMFPGAIQLPPDGAAIVLGPDAPVTGGYPVLASVIAADLPALGQLAPRERVSFELITLTDALAAYHDLLAALDAALAPARCKNSP